MGKERKGDEEEENVVDYTNPQYACDDQVRISNGFNIDDLSEGIIFNPEIEERPNNDENIRYYSATDAEDLANLMNEKMMMIGGEENAGDIETEDFDEIRKRMVDISGDGGVMKRVVKNGLMSHGLVPARAVVKMHYSLYLEGQDEPFDSTLLRGKAEKHKIGDQALLLGVEMGIRTMRMYEKAQFMINHEYALGEMGCPPRVPRRAQFLAIVEVLDFTEETEAEAALAIDEEERNKTFSFDRILKICTTEQYNGNQAVKKKEFSVALKNYDRARKLLEDLRFANEDEETECHNLLEKILLNIAHCANKVNKPKKACVACKDALKIRVSAKALYRFGIAKRQLEDYEGSRELLLKAQNMAPESVTVSNELRILEDYLSQQRRREAAMCKKMFKGMERPTEEKIDADSYDMYFRELKNFKECEKETLFSLSLKDVDLRAICKAAGDLQLKVDQSGGKITISKE